MNIRLLFAGLVSLLLHGLADANEATWITNVKLVSPEKLDQVEAGSVLVENGRIARVERGTQKRAPAGAREVDGKGYYLTPGLIDSHVHLQSVPGVSFEQAKEMASMAEAYYAQLPRSYLYYGYTTLVDLMVLDRAVIDRVLQAPLHPDVVHCGPPLIIANGYPMAYMPRSERFKIFGNFIYDPEQAHHIPKEYAPAAHTPAVGAARAKAAGAVCVKTTFERGFGGQRNLPVMSTAMFGEVRAAASANGLVLVTHANSFDAQKFAVDGNTDVLAHGMWNWGSLASHTGLPAEIKAVLDRIVEKKIGYQPTMQVLYGLRAYFEPEYLRDPAISKVVPGEMVAWFNTPAGKWFRHEIAENAPDAQVRQGMDVPLSHGREVVAYLAAKDANFLFGSDTPSSPTYGNLPGLNGFVEMQRLRTAGMSASQIFKAATISNARAFGIEKQVGTIEPGKVAHLLLMKTSPLEDMEAYNKIVTVWVGGKQVERESLAADNK